LFASSLGDLVDMQIKPEFDEREVDEIVASVWFNMDIDYKQFGLLDEKTRAEDIERFVSVQAVRYSILTKVIKEAHECKNYGEYKQVLARASDIMVVARGVQSGQGGTKEDISGDSRNNSSGAER